MRVEEMREQEKLIVKVTGRLDTTTAPQLEEELKASIEEVNYIIMDFSNLEYISSAGLRVLWWAYKAMKAQEGSLVVRGANEEVREVFTITGFAEVFHLEN